MSKQKNVFDDIAGLVNKYGDEYESALAAGDIDKAETYRIIALELCEIITKRGVRA